MAVIDTSEFKKGLKIEVDSEPFEIVEFQHVKPGKGSAFVRTSIRSLISGRTLQPTFKSGDKFQKAEIEELDMQFLYKEGTDYYFMDTHNYEQTFVNEAALGDSINYMKENVQASIMFYNGKAIGVTMPNSVDLTVKTCDPGMKGDTVSGALKPAILETGYKVMVPLFINEGDVLKIDTRDGKYLTRVTA